MVAAPAAVVSDLVSPHAPQRPSENSTSCLPPGTRESLASVAATLKARMSASSPAVAAPLPTSQHQTTTPIMGTNTTLEQQASQTPTPASTPVPVPATVPRSSPANVPASSAPVAAPVPVAAVNGGSSSASQQPTPPLNVSSSQPPTGHVSPAIASAALPRPVSQGPPRLGGLAHPQASSLHVPSLPSLPAPGSGAGQPRGRTGPLTSPTLDNKQQAQGAIESCPEYAELINLIQKTNSSIVRQAIRDQWHKCLVGSEYHTTFVANAIFHQANPSTLSRAIQDFGNGLVKTSKHQIIKHFGMGDIDELTSVIFPKLSNKFMDQVLARRLETIGAQDLVNALARAERLGYDIHDVVEGKHGSRGEHVIPYMASAGPPPVPSHRVPVPPAPQSRILSSQQHHSTKNPTWVYSPGMAAPGMATPAKPLQAPPHVVPSHPNPKPIVQGLKGIVYCNLCCRPCSGPTALNYHIRKAKCQKTERYVTFGKGVCIHCGCAFGGAGGLVYHTKSEVCGSYPEEVRQRMVIILESYDAANSRPHDVFTPAPRPSSSIQHKTPGQLAATASTPTPTKAIAPASTPSSNDPYAKLTPEERERFEAEMRQGEEFYGRLMQEAMKLSKPHQDEELAKLKNRYNTRQSMTRKKYGIRLRERRSQAEIEAERSRLFGPSDANANGHAAKKARIDHEGQARVTQSGGPITQTESPRKRVPMAEMGGLSESSATAELVDPTASMAPSRSQHLQQPNHPSNGPAIKAIIQGAPQAASQGTSGDPMRIDTSDDSDTDSDDEDIPAKAIAV